MALLVFAKAAAAKSCHPVFFAGYVSEFRDICGGCKG